MCIDFFVSHSKEMKEAVAIPLVQTLSVLGFNVWIDRKEIKSGQFIYQEIKHAISNSTYCIAIIDSVFLSRPWTKEELKLFYDRETEENRTIVLPIFVNINKETVYEIIPWLAGRAFEKLDEVFFDRFANFEIICRVVGRYSTDNMHYTFEKCFQKLTKHSFPCKETLLTLIKDKQYLSTDMRISIIEMCNIGGVVNAIYKAITTTPNKNINISFEFSNVLRSLCFDANYSLTYSMYISTVQIMTVAIEQLEILLDSR